jgi:hypothetical protein
MVTFPKLEITMIGSTKMSLEDVKKAYRTVHASIKNNHTRDRRNEADLFARNGAVTPGRGYSKVFKGDCRTCRQTGQMTNINVIIATKMATVKIDATRRKGTQEVKL